MHILVVGNCQAGSLAKLIESMSDSIVTHVKLLPSTMVKLRSGEIDIATLDSNGLNIASLVARSDLILLQSGVDIIGVFEGRFPKSSAKIRLFPRITFSAFHPDMIYIKNALASPTGGYHSSIACFGWLHGLSIEETLGLFNADVYKKLGFFEYWDSSVKFLVDEGYSAGLSLEQLIESWTRQGVWMHSINHPKLFVLRDLSKAVLLREGVPYAENEQDMEDILAKGPSWAVYPEIANSLGFSGKYEFKKGFAVLPKDPSVLFFGLEQFVRASYEKYSSYSLDDFNVPRFASAAYRELGRFVKNAYKGGKVKIEGARWNPTDIGTSSPYQGLPDYQFWRRSMERLPMRDVDPVVRSRFTLGLDSKVATAGSCFAQHIARTLQKNGFNYYVSEKGDDLLPEVALKRNYGVFSSRYGNLYTTRQLVQLFDRAYGTFVPVEHYWSRPDGKYVDAFRPQVEPDGFATLDELESSRRAHFEAVREMFEHLDVFVFTLGLTEAWASRKDGSIYPLAPGVVAGKMDSASHEFVNFTVRDVVDDMQSFVERLLSVNAGAKMILTVSPVPLIATYEDRHVLVSNTYSKSVLRVAAEEICRQNAMCDYFPSYEIITGNYTKGAYFEDDLRSVKPEGVEHVMRLFLAHYAEEKRGDCSLDRDLMQENALVADVVCDEEAIDSCRCG